MQDKPLKNPPHVFSGESPKKLGMQRKVELEETVSGLLAEIEQSNVTSITPEIPKMPQKENTHVRNLDFLRTFVPKKMSLTLSEDQKATDAFAKIIGFCLENFKCAPTKEYIARKGLETLAYIIAKNNDLLLVKINSLTNGKEVTRNSLEWILNQIFEDAIK